MIKFMHGFGEVFNRFKKQDNHAFATFKRGFLPRTPSGITFASHQISLRDRTNHEHRVAVFSTNSRF
jgi:hypothetical protein